MTKPVLRQRDRVVGSAGLIQQAIDSVQDQFVAVDRERVLAAIAIDVDPQVERRVVPKSFQKSDKRRREP